MTTSLKQLFLAQIGTQELIIILMIIVPIVFILIAILAFLKGVRKKDKQL